MKRVLQWILVAAVGFVTGKWCKYAAVEYLGDRLGFNCASVIGLTPFMIGIVYLKAKYPHVVDHRKRLPER